MVLLSMLKPLLLYFFHARISLAAKRVTIFIFRRVLMQEMRALGPPVHAAGSPHRPVEAVGAEAMSTLGLKRPSQNVVAAVAQVLVLQLVAQDLLGEARLVALHGRRRRRLLCGHGVSSRVTPEEDRGRKSFLFFFGARRRAETGL